VELATSVVISRIVKDEKARGEAFTMGYHPRIETSEYTDFLTTRTRNSQLWFVNNQRLQEAILGYAAKYATIHSVSLYALAIEGNHIQAPAHFSNGNRALFMRDFNASVARAVPRYCQNYPGGNLWGRRYSQEFLPGNADVEEYFFYTVLQPVQDGLVEKLSEYPGYNCFHDAVWGIKRRKKVVSWGALYEARRWNQKVSVKEYTVEYVLEYKRLPGYEGLSQEEYARVMHEKLEARRVEIVRKRYESGKGFAGRKGVKSITPGAYPRTTKRSHASSHRPRVLCVCPKRRVEALNWYFEMYFEYQEASRKYRVEGEFMLEFPPGMYKPPLPPGSPAPVLQAA